MCESIATSLYPRAVIGFTQAMPCIPLPVGRGPHRPKDLLVHDFADVPFWDPSCELEAMQAHALPADNESDLVGEDKIRDLPGEMRRDAKAWKKGIKVVFSDEGEDTIPGIDRRSSLQLAPETMPLPLPVTRCHTQGGETA